MPEDFYENLRELFDTHPVGCAPAPEMIEILKILMERSAEVPEPPENYMELGLRLLQEKGTLEKFIEANTPKKVD